MKTNSPRYLEKPVTHRNLPDLLHCDMKDKNGTPSNVFVTSATAPFHIEWVSKGWCDEFGWSSDEILGHDCGFLQGASTNFHTVSNFMRELASSGGHASMSIINYRKDGTAVQNKVACYPIVDDREGTDVILNLECVIVEVKDISSGLDSARGESGLVVDRREGCKVYRYRKCVDAPCVSDWALLMRSFSLPLVLRYALRSKAAHVVTDIEGRIVHVNEAWVDVTGLSAIHCLELELRSIFSGTEDKESNQLALYDRLLARCRNPIDSSTTALRNPLAAVVTIKKDALSSKSTAMHTPFGSWQVPSSVRNVEKVLNVCPVAIGSDHIVILVVPYV